MRDSVKIIGGIIDKSGTAMIGSVDGEGFPNMKAMLPPRKREGISEFYFTTNLTFFANVFKIPSFIKIIKEICWYDIPCEVLKHDRCKIIKWIVVRFEFFKNFFRRFWGR